MKIIIVGAGWYGLHTYCFLKKKLKNKIDIIILKKIHGDGNDNHGCWESHYNLSKIEGYLNDLNSRCIQAPLWFKNNRYI